MNLDDLTAGCCPWCQSVAAYCDHCGDELHHESEDLTIRELLLWALAHECPAGAMPQLNR